MKKATSATIGGRIFHLEEEAFEVLSTYLETLRTHFSGDEGQEEIIGDIEARVADRLAELEPGYRPGAIPREAVDEILDSIGWPDELNEGGAVPADTPTEPRKLFRDPKAGMIGGVCEGLGSYFDVRPLWVRLILLVGILLMGLSIALYLLLWLLMPPVRTTADRLAMGGRPVTLSTVAGMTEPQAPPSRSAVGRLLHRFFRLPRRMMDAAIDRTRILVAGGSPILRKTIGAGLVISGGFVILLTLLALGVALAGFPPSYLDESYTVIMRDLSSRALLIPLAACVLIPAAMVALGGFAILRNQSVLPPPVAFGMIGVWFLAAVVGGIQGAQAMMRWEAFEASSPLFRELTQTVEPGEFAELRARPMDWVQVRVLEGDVPMITFAGQQKDLDNIIVRREGEALLIDRRIDPCVMCDMDFVEVTVVVPNPDSVILPQHLVEMRERELLWAEREREEEERQREMEQVQAARALAEAQSVAEELRIQALQRQLEVRRLEAQVQGDTIGG